MANERVNEDEAEAILSNLKMEGRFLTNCWVVDGRVGRRVGGWWKSILVATYWWVVGGSFVGFGMEGLLVVKAV